MCFPKCIQLSFTTAVVTAIFVMLPAITLAQSTVYRFEDDSTFSFNAGFVGGQGFDLSGTFTLNESPDSATITDAIFSLVPNSPSPFPDSDLFSATEVGDLLENAVIEVETSTPSQTVYQLFFGPRADDTLSITVDDLSANRLLTLSGSGSTELEPIIVDGSNFGFSATAVAVPEPTALPVCLLLAITLTLRRVRGNFLPALEA